MKQGIKKVLRQVLGYSADDQIDTAQTDDTPGASPASPLQVYSGYEEQDLATLKKFATATASTAIDHYTDGFGVKTLYECVPFLKPELLDIQRLQLPVPDDGFHAEAIEYVAITDACNRFLQGTSFCAVEIGAGWAPWIAIAGVIGRRQGIKQFKLVGVEASSQRFPLMQRHLETNGLRPPDAAGEDAQCGTVFTRLFNGAIWTHDGVIRFPETDVADMGAAVTTSDGSTDYRGAELNNRSIACKKLDTLLQDLGVVDFMHIDIQGGELELLQDQIDWVSANVRTLMIATHSRSIEGKLIDLFFSKGWLLHREKPCRVDWYRNCSLVGKTTADGSQYWLNRKFV